MINETQTIERLVLYCLDIAQDMLEEYDLVIPFGTRAFADSDDVKMQSYQEQLPEANWGELISFTAEELKKLIKKENIFAVAIVSSIETDDGTMGVGLQLDTRKGPVLFFYPYYRQDDKWFIDEPSKADILVAPRVFA